MAVVGVFGLLRIGELCFSRTGDTTKCIRNKDVTCRGVSNSMGQKRIVRKREQQNILLI
jgi:hypothetical protein